MDKIVKSLLLRPQTSRSWCGQCSEGWSWFGSGIPCCVSWSGYVSGKYVCHGHMYLNFYSKFSPPTEIRSQSIGISVVHLWEKDLFKSERMDIHPQMSVDHLTWRHTQHECARELPARRGHGREQGPEAKTQKGSSRLYGVGGGALVEQTNKMESGWSLMCIRLSGSSLALPQSHNGFSSLLVHHRKVDVLDWQVRR